MCAPTKITVENPINIEKKIHCVGLNEAIIANLAIVLQKKGYEITGSLETVPQSIVADILTQHHLLPKELGFSGNNINSHLDQVIIGREIDDKNIEVTVARKLGIPIVTYAEYICEYAQDRQRIVITGDADRTAILIPLVIHVLEYWHRSFDYVTTLFSSDNGIQLKDSPIILLQADVYATTAADTRPQFLSYQPHIAVINGLDTVYCKDEPTLKLYLDWLTKLVNGLPKAGRLLYNSTISYLKEIAKVPRLDVKSIPYHTPVTRVKGKQTYLVTSEGDFPLSNYNNLTLEAVGGAYSLLKELAITDMQFYEAISNCSNLQS